MKYIYLGSIEPGKLPEMTEEQQQAMLDECFEYDNHLRANGYLAAGEGLRVTPAQTHRSLKGAASGKSSSNGRISLQKREEHR